MDLYVRERTFLLMLLLGFLVAVCRVRRHLQRQHPNAGDVHRVQQEHAVVEAVAVYRVRLPSHSKLVLGKLRWRRQL